MQLKHWRKKKYYTQKECAEKLEQFARELYPEQKIKKLGQTTVGSWERGTLPRKFWLTVIMQFTKNHVTSQDFVTSQRIDNGAECSA